MGHILDGQRKVRRVEIVKFSGYAEIDETEGTEHETIFVHFSDQSAVEFDDLERAVFITRTYQPISFSQIGSLIEVNGDTEEQAEIEEQRKAKIEAERKAKAELAHASRASRRKSHSRPIEAYTDSELMAKITSAPLSVAEDVMTAYEGNLARMANSTAKQMRKITGIGEVRSEKIIAAFELGKRLARFHAEKAKITSPADVADLMMSKLRYLQKEVAVVLALDTKGGVTSTGKAGEIAGDLKWGKMIA